MYVFINLANLLFQVNEILAITSIPAADVKAVNDLGGVNQVQKRGIVAAMETVNNLLDIQEITC